MDEYKVIFESGVTEIIEVEELELNEHIGSVKVMDSDGKKIENFYLDLENISALLPK